MNRDNGEREQILAQVEQTDFDLQAWLARYRCTECGHQGICEEAVDVFIAMYCQKCYNKKMMGYTAAVSAYSDLFQLEGADVLMAVDSAGYWLMVVNVLDSDEPLLEEVVFEGHVPLKALALEHERELIQEFIDIDASEALLREDMVDEQVGLQREQDWVADDAQVFSDSEAYRDMEHEGQYDYGE